METNEIIHAVTNVLKPVVVEAVKPALDTTQTTQLTVALIGLLTVVISGLFALWIGKKTKQTTNAVIEIKHSVNSDRDRMISEGKVMMGEIAGLKKSIGMLLVERAGTAKARSHSEAELQNPEPLPKLDPRLNDPCEPERSKS